MSSTPGQPAVNRGALYEGDVFSVLRTSPYVVRSYEFALTDGAIDCTRTYDPEASFSDRFWEVDQAQHLKTEASSLVLFDVKSKMSVKAGRQFFITTVAQRLATAFYIGIYGADPSYVEVIPNYHQHSSTPPAFSPEEGRREVSVNPCRASTLPPTAYTLNPAGAPYRMPILLLPEAIRRIRRCAQGKGPYVNPWTEVTFSDWRPLAVHSTRHLHPSEASQHFTACAAAMEIYRVVRSNSSAEQIRFDFVGLQPRLADFKFLTEPLSRAGVPRQSLIQHKLDSRNRSRAALLEKVPIGRSGGGCTRWYFSATDRFDFLFYQFSFSNLPHPNRHIEFFFIPERELPDTFYDTLDLEASFELPQFKRYRSHMDKKGRWLEHVLRVILENPQPRQLTGRPKRIVPRPSKADVGDATSAEAREDPGGGGRGHGHSLYKQMLTRNHRVFFQRVMEQCAERLRGLLVSLAADHPAGDFAFCDYTWTTDEQLAFRTTGVPPKTSSSLPSSTPLVPICYYTRDVECTFYGPAVTSPQFRRLDSCQVSRLVAWDLWGPDGQSQSQPIALVPSEDISPTQAQKELFAANFGIDKSKSFASRTPLISHLLVTGKNVSAYSVGSCGPLVYENGGHKWEAVWRLLLTFATSLQPVEHPKDGYRHPAQYRHSLAELHTLLITCSVSIDNQESLHE